MSHDEEMAVIGRLVSEHRDAKREQALLRAEAKRIGGIIAEVGACIQHDDPMHSAFTAFDEEHLTALDPAKVKQLVNDIHSLSGKIAGYASQLRSLNLPVD